jgi:hypothetical protein
METVAALALGHRSNAIAIGSTAIAVRRRAGIDEAEIWGIIKPQELRTAAGGGRDRPPNFRLSSASSDRRNNLPGHPARSARPIGLCSERRVEPAEPIGAQHPNMLARNERVERDKP